MAISSVTAASAGRSNASTTSAVGFGVLAALMALTIIVTTRLPNHRGRW
jgi:hypothetical protein